MSGVGIFAAIIIGIFAGWIAERVLNRKHGLFTNLIVGVIGSFIGAFLARQLGFVWAGFLGSLVVSTIGAIILLFLGVYIGLALIVADHLPNNRAVQLLFFVIAGMGWGVPLLPLLSWMETGRFRFTKRLGE
jgi:uncharacterized membrane protein YeaQ/YmgE (transglycosylase-associated protein family)